MESGLTLTAGIGSEQPAAHPQNIPELLERQARLRPDSVALRHRSAP